MEKRLRIAIDMDEVIADVLYKFLKLYHRDFGTPLIINPISGKEFYENFSEDLWEHWYIYINEKGFFRDLPVMPHAQEVIRMLNTKHDVYIVSAAMEFRNSLEDKLDWLEEHFPFIKWTNILFTGKKIISADVLIDDRIKNFQDFDGRSILYSSPHNLLIKGYERVDNWLEIAQLFDLK